MQILCSVRGHVNCPFSVQSGARVRMRSILSKQAEVAQGVRAMLPMRLRASGLPAHAIDRGSIYPAARHSH